MTDDADILFLGLYTHILAFVEYIGLHVCVVWNYY
jgi:hypothetical protein